MISIHHLIENLDKYKQELVNRGGHPDLATEVFDLYQQWKKVLQVTENLRSKKNDFNKEVIKLEGVKKQEAIKKMKIFTENLKFQEDKLKEIKTQLDKKILKIPSLSSSETPIGKSDENNIVIQVFGDKPNFDFEPKPYWELPLYKAYVSQENGVKAMGARGYYLTGQMANFQRILFNYALDIVLAEGFELFYVPLMLNADVFTGTGHLPDFDDQMYEIPLDENKSYYLIGTSEPSIMGYYMNKNLENLKKPILNTSWTSCFRKEAGSYGKDQQGILRVHQFEKVEMVAIGTKEQCLDQFDKMGKIEEKIYSSLGLHYRSVEVCTGDMPAKHYRQIDYEAWFPGVNKFREICSNGNASDFQNRGLNITYKNKNGQKETPWGLNCTAITFRTGLAILEQNQQIDGSVILPEALVSKFGSNKLEANTSSK